MPNDWQEIDALVGPFEKAWQKGGRPAIDDFLPKVNPLRLAVLKELVHIDLEWRRRVGEPKKVEDYLERFPELATVSCNATVINEAPEQEPVPAESTTAPKQIGRYAIEKM